MSKQQIIEQIREANPSAPVEFLLAFDRAQLEAYLMRLALTKAPRNQLSVWMRTSFTPALVTSGR